MRAAVVGCGRMGAGSTQMLDGYVPAGWLPLSHAEAIRATQGVDLVALCDTDKNMLREAGSRYEVHDLFTDYRQLIDKVAPEILTVATRTPPKSEIVRYACDRGVKGVYVEKPIANRLDDCRQILSHVKQAGMRMAYGVNRRYHAVYRHAKNLIRKGEIGEVVEIVAEHGTSQLLWSHPHSVDLILDFHGSTDLASVQANLRPDTVQRVSEFIVDSDPVVESAFFRFAGGTTAWIARSGGLSLRVGGTTGNLIVHADGSFIQVYKGSGKQPAYYLDQTRVDVPPERGATVTAFTELVESIRSGRAPESLDLIETGTLMLMACVWSHLNEGRSVTPSECPPKLAVTGKFGSLYA